MKIAVLMGGISSERNISLLSGKAAFHALVSKGHEVLAIDPALGASCVLSLEQINSATNKEVSPELLNSFSTRSYIDCVNSSAFDGVEIAFLLLHGTHGEDGKIQALLEMRGIPYTGCGIEASAIAMDKVMSKQLFQNSNIATPQFLAYSDKFLERERENLDQEVITIREYLGDKIVIKPNDQGSTVGMSIVKTNDVEAVIEALVLAATLSKTVLVERFVEGRELTVPVIGNEAYPVIEIIPDGGFYDYKHKYTKGQTTYVCPADIPEDVEEYVKNAALQAHASLGCSVYSRVDFRLDEEFIPWCLEVNTLPGFTETSLVPMSAKENGIEFADLCELLIELSLKK